MYEISQIVVDGVFFTVIAQATDYNARIQIGVADEEDSRRIAFGMGAEVGTLHQQRVAEVGQGSIGAHSTETARLRVRAYSLAISLAEAMNVALAEETTTLEEAVRLAVGSLEA